MTVADPQVQPGCTSTPISDAIRDNLHGRLLSSDWSGEQRSNCATATGKFQAVNDRPLFSFLGDTKTLPAFQENELDNPHLLSSAAAEIYRMRRARDRLMPKGLTGEPAWDMLLALYAEEPAKLPVSSVCYASGVPGTTALRWLKVLQAQGLVERSPHGRDGRIILLSLTSQGRLIMERSLRAMLRASGM